MGTRTDSILGKIGGSGGTPPTYHRAYVHFTTVMDKRTLHDSKTMEIMLHDAAMALAEEIIKMDNVIEIQKNYDACTMYTHIRHRIQVLVKE